METADIPSSVYTEVESIRNQVISMYLPTKIILFGSQTKGTAVARSDIDLCIIKDTNNKRELLIMIGFGLKKLKVYEIRNSLKTNNCGNDVVAFHSQQAIEKSLKGFLLNKIG